MSNTIIAELQSMYGNKWEKLTNEQLTRLHEYLHTPDRIFALENQLKAAQVEMEQWKDKYLWLRFEKEGEDMIDEIDIT